jgi:hypothetical protein
LIIRGWISADIISLPFEEEDETVDFTMGFREAMQRIIVECVQFC